MILQPSYSPPTQTESQPSLLTLAVPSAHPPAEVPGAAPRVGAGGRLQPALLRRPASHRPHLAHALVIKVRVPVVLKKRLFKLRFQNDTCCLELLNPRIKKLPAPGPCRVNSSGQAMAQELKGRCCEHKLSNYRVLVSNRCPTQSEDK